MLMALIIEENKKCYNYSNFITHMPNFNLCFCHTAHFQNLFMVQMDLYTLFISINYFIEYKLILNSQNKAMK